MQKLDEAWESAFNSVRSSFVVFVDRLQQVGSSDEYQYSEVCGFGWRFKATRASLSQPSGDHPADVTLYIYPHHLDRSRFTDILTTVESASCGFVQTSKLSGSTASSSPSAGVTIASFKSSFAQVIVDVTVRIPKTFGISFPPVLRKGVSQVLAQAITGEETIDIKFYAFTRKSSQGASHPRALYGSSAVLQGHSDYLDILLGNDFSESKVIDLDAHSLPDEEQSVELYDYESDSDLDEEEFLSRNDPKGKQSASPSSAVFIEGSSSGSYKDFSPVESIYSRGRMGRVVILKSKAYKTWKALLFFLYTGQITFAPLSSHPRAAKPSAFSPAACSAKSMYRLADELAFDHIRANICKENIVTEVFSKFSSSYPPILEYQINFFNDHCGNPAVQAAFQEKPDFITGQGQQMPHCATTLFMLWTKARFSDAPLGHPIHPAAPGMATATSEPTETRAFPTVPLPARADTPPLSAGFPTFETVLPGSRPSSPTPQADYSGGWGCRGRRSRRGR